jgi:hypothetical protein
MKRILQSIVMLFCLLIGLSAATITHTATVFPALTNWSLTNSVPQFDPSLGALTNVSITVSANVRNRVRVESRSNLPRTATAGGTATITATVAGYSAAASVTNSYTQALGGFDGVIDYAGASGFDQTLDGSGYDAATPPDFTPYIGAGTVPLVAASVANGSYSGPGDYRFIVNTTASALVTVTYEFSPPTCPECDPEPDCERDRDRDDRRKPRNKRR